MKQNRFYAEYARYDGGWRLFDRGECVGRGVEDDLALKAFARFLNSYCPTTMSPKEFVLGMINEIKGER